MLQQSKIGTQLRVSTAARATCSFRGITQGNKGGYAMWGSLSAGSLLPGVFSHHGEWRACFLGCRWFLTLSFWGCRKCPGPSALVGSAHLPNSYLFRDIYAHVNDRSWISARVMCTGSFRGMCAGVAVPSVI